MHLHYKLKIEFCKKLAHGAKSTGIKKLVEFKTSGLCSLAFYKVGGFPLCTNYLCKIQLPNEYSCNPNEYNKIQNA
jgi:hypothetical protein